MYEDDLEQDVEVDDNRGIEESNGDKEDLLCFENILLSSNNTTKLIHKSIVKDDMKILYDAPGANVLIFIDEEVSEIDKICCALLDDDNIEVRYSIIFINVELAEKLNKDYNLNISSESIMGKEDIEHEISKILSEED